LKVEKHSISCSLINHYEALYFTVYIFGYGVCSAKPEVAHNGEYISFNQRFEVKHPVYLVRFDFAEPFL
jgi:hypothetical protein